MKLSVLVWSIACACATLPAHGQAVRNPLRPAAAAGGAAAAPALPATRPGAYLAGKRPLVPLPPPGLPPFVLPPAAATAATVPALTPAQPGDAHSASPASPGSAAGTGPAPDAAHAAKPARPADRPPSQVFLSRDALQQSRSHCVVERKDKAPLQFAAAGGERTVRLRVQGGRACVKALSSSHAWLRVSALSGDNELTVSADENEEPTAREGVVVVANTGSAVRIDVEQAPNTTGFRRIEL